MKQNNQSILKCVYLCYIRKIKKKGVRAHPSFSQLFTTHPCFFFPKKYFVYLNIDLCVCVK